MNTNKSYTNLNMNLNFSRQQTNLRQKLSNLEKRHSKNIKPGWKQHLHNNRINQLVKNDAGLLGDAKMGFESLNKHDLIKIILD
jgi:hypothetical protein